MKNLLFIGFFSFIITVSQINVFAKDLPTSSEGLRNELETALKAGDIKAALALNNWKDVSDEIPYGDSDGKFYVAGTVQEVFDLHPKPAVQLSIFAQVLGSGLPNSGKFTGSYMYILQSGKEAKKDFNGVGNLSKAFAGLYL